MPRKTVKESEAAGVTVRDERAREIGRRIALARREANGMTQRVLALELGVTERTVASWEAGTSHPHRHLYDLERVLDRPAAWILYGDSEDAEASAMSLQQLRAAQKQLDEKLESLRLGQDLIQAKLDQIVARLQTKFELDEAAEPAAKTPNHAAWPVVAT